MNADLVRRARRLARLRRWQELAVRRKTRAGHVVPPVRHRAVCGSDERQALS